MQRENSFEVLDIEHVITDIDGECEVKSDALSESDANQLREKSHEEAGLIYQDIATDIPPSYELEDTSVASISTDLTDSQTDSPIVIADSYGNYEHTEEDVLPVLQSAKTQVVEVSCQTVPDAPTGCHTSGRILIVTVVVALLAGILSFNRIDESNCDKLSALQDELEQLKLAYNQSLLRDSNRAAESHRSILELQAERLKLYTALSSSQQRLNELTNSYHSLQTMYHELEAVHYSVTKDMQQFRKLASELRDRGLIFPGSHLLNRLLCRLLRICPEPLLFKTSYTHFPSPSRKSSCSDDSTCFH